MSIIIHDEAIVVRPVAMRPPARRGRPRVDRPSKDTGTPELVMKRLLGETAETLDLCLERGIITPQQHWCGIHLRWLYTLRHGAPGVRAVDPTHLGGIEIKLDDPEWRISREKEYHDAVQKLNDRGLAALMMNLCIHNERPKFLSLHAPVTEARAREATAFIENLRAGLDLLVTHWGRDSK